MKFDAESFEAYSLESEDVKHFIKKSGGLENLGTWRFTEFK